MNKYKLIVCEDNSSLIPVLESYCIELKYKYPNLEYEFLDFSTLIKIDKSYESTTNLILLDLLDETNTKQLLGINILEIIKSRDIKIPVIVNTTLKDSAGSAININELKASYPFATFLQKYDIGTSLLKDKIELHIKNSLDDQFEIDSDYIDEFKQQLNYFGKSSINQILFDIKNHYNILIDQKVKLFKLKSGFSGAILFKFNFNNTDFVLKISKDIKLLEKELEKARNFYPLFPTKFFNNIVPKEFYTNSHDTMAIVIKLIPNTKTLFDTILNSSSTSEINDIFNEIYNNNGLKSHYLTQVHNSESWTTIFNKFKNGRFITISEVYKELSPLLTNFNLVEVQNLIENNDFKGLNSIKIKNEGKIILNHLDLHSKNILIQGEKASFLIDTGVMDYGYWCFDICRLLVDLFINGIDIDTKDFFDINSIEKNIELGKKLIQMESINYDSKNDRIIDAINWLTSNAKDIYANYFTPWEFQLGLMKEFLQMSYRTGSVPHSKRALSLELAYFCMIEAEQNVVKS